jgi:hypothetical protein
MALLPPAGSSSDHAAGLPLGLTGTLDQRPHEPDRIGPYRPRDRYEFDDVDAALAAFILGHERLRLSNAFGEFLLGEPGSLASSDHQLAEYGEFGRMDRFADAARRGCHRRGRLILESGYPKRG